MANEDVISEIFDWFISYEIYFCETPGAILRWQWIGTMRSSRTFDVLVWIDGLNILTGKQIQYGGTLALRLAPRAIADKLVYDEMECLHWPTDQKGKKNKHFDSDNVAIYTVDLHRANTESQYPPEIAKFIKYEKLVKDYGGVLQNFIIS